MYGKAFQCAELFNDYFIANAAADCATESILKVGQYMAMTWTRVRCVNPV